MSNEAYDAVVVGSGPNGLAAAITLAQAGLSVLVFEAKDTIGGGLRTAELTLPGFLHDVCSAVHPLAVSSPFFSPLPLANFGLDWIHPTTPLAHPFDDGTVACLERSFETTGATLGPDAQVYRSLMEPLVNNWDKLKVDLLAPLHFPKHPLLVAHFAWLGLRSASGLAKNRFVGEKAKGLFAGLAAHSILPLNQKISAAFGLILGTLGHAVGWPIPRGGSQNIANALAAYLKQLGGEIITNSPIKSLNELPKAKAYFLDVTPRQLLEIAGEKLPSGYCDQLKKYRYGPGVFKMDWALREPIPWTNSKCKLAGTVHLGGSLSEIQNSEEQVWQGNVPDAPFVLLSQPSLFDTSRAPLDQHTAWAYCHVPNGSEIDMSERIESQIERFAPGFKDCILARSCKSAKELENYNPNYVGGDINGGVQDLYQLFTRPTMQPIPYETALEGLYLCSSSTPPGGGVHGMCGYYAAKAAMKKIFKIV